MSDADKLNRETYDRIAEDWNSDHTHDDWWVVGTEKFIEMLPKGGTVLDVGCGSGLKTKYLTDKGLKVVGTDLSPKMIEIAMRELPKGEFYVADMHDLAHVPGIYDGIFMQAALLHIPKNEINAVITEVKKKLKPAGLLYVAVKGQREGQPEEAVVKENDYGCEFERFFSYFTMPELKEILSRHNFECVHELFESRTRTDWLQVIGKQVSI